MSGNLVGCRMHLAGDVHYSVLERIGAWKSAEGISILRSEKNGSVSRPLRFISLYTDDGCSVIIDMVI